MRSGWFALGLGLASLSPAPLHADDSATALFAFARASSRPAECGGPNQASASRWERARRPGLGRFCDAMARGQAALAGAPDDALAAAGEAEKSFPGRAAPQVLSARALFRRGSFDEAWKRFESARARDPRSLDSPTVLFDYARCALREKQEAAALGAYRALVARVDVLSDERLRIRVLVEAAALVMNTGPEQLPEAIGYLVEARRRPNLPGLSDYVRGALALALDRRGSAAEAALVTAEAAGPWTLEDARDPRNPAAVGLPELPPGELDAIIAMLAEGHGGDLALERWTSYVEAAGSAPRAFLDRARAHRDALKRKGTR